MKPSNHATEMLFLEVCHKNYNHVHTSSITVNIRIVFNSNHKQGLLCYSPIMSCGVQGLRVKIYDITITLYDTAHLKDWIFLVPEGEGEAEPALTVRDAQQPVLPPAVGPGASVVVREVVPAEGGSIEWLHIPIALTRDQS